MIQTITIQNFRSLRKVSVDLERFTVFVGANGSGKTSVLEAMQLAALAAARDPDKVFARERHCDWIYTRGGAGDFSIRCDTAAGRFGVEATPPPGHPPPPELMQKTRWQFRSQMAGPTPARATAYSALHPVHGMEFLRPDPAVMANPSYSDDVPPRMSSTGKGLGSVLAYMALEDPAGLDNLVALAKTLIPRLDRIRFRKTKVYRTEREVVRFGKDAVAHSTRRPYQGESILFDFEHAENVSARNASEGTILLLGLLAVLLGPSRPRVLLVDDIDRSLHPLAQKQLVATIGRILQEYPDLQLLATAHSPYLLNYLAPEQVRIMATGSDGYARCGSLADHPKFAAWKEEMAPGEMWSLFGENWLVEEEAAP